MNIFITGASGFVGGAIAAKLKETHRVRAMSRSEKSDAAIRMSGVEPVRTDLESITPEQLEGCDAVIHCAAFVGPWGSHQQFWNGNVAGTRHLLKVARHSGVKRFIHMGTEAALFNGRPMVLVNEDLPYPRHNPYLYGATKQEAEKLVLAANREDFQTLVLRPRLVWGPGDTSVLPTLRQMIATNRFMWLDGGRHRTSTTCIINLVHAAELALTAGQSGRAYFISDGEDSRLREFFTAMLATQNVTIPDKSMPGFLARGAAYLTENIWRLFGLRGEPPLMRFPIDAMSRECTVRIDRARQELGYEPVVTVAEGLARMHEVHSNCDKSATATATARK